jgi:hypothetical protein
MGLNFPSSPAIGALHPDPAQAGVPQYKWDGEKWLAVGGAGSTGAAIYVSDTPPAGAPDNALWWESDSGILYLKYNDGTSAQWVIAVAVGSSGTGGDTSGLVLKSGDTMTGHLGLPTGPSATHAVRKDYVDTADALKVAKAGDTMTGLLTTASPASSISGAAYSNALQVLGTGNAMLTFLIPSVFAAHFGMTNDGNLYIGGGNLGAGNAFRLWTTRDFTSVAFATAARLVYAGDYGHDSSSIVEPFSGAVVSGSSTYDSGNARITLRYRYLQLLVSGGWTSVPYSG